MSSYTKLSSRSGGVNDGENLVEGVFHRVELLALNGKKEIQEYFVASGDVEATVLQEAADHWNASQLEPIMI